MNLQTVIQVVTEEENEMARRSRKGLSAHQMGLINRLMAQQIGSAAQRGAITRILNSLDPEHAKVTDELPAHLQNLCFTLGKAPPVS